MTIDELKNYVINPGLAYVIGLIFPYYKKGKDKNGREFIKGCVNYNTVIDEDLAAHFRLVRNFLDANNLTTAVLELKSNRQDDFSISSKKGFSALIYAEDKSDKECIEILFLKAKEIKDSNNFEIQKEFMKGCFDGRLSFDSSRHFLAIDADRDYSRQNLIKEIFLQNDIDLNLNQREENYPKNDQIRIRPKDIGDFLTRIGLFNVMKKRQIENWLNGESD